MGVGGSISPGGQKKKVSGASCPLHHQNPENAPAYKHTSNNGLYHQVGKSIF